MRKSRERWKGVGLWARVGLSPDAREVQIRACSAWIFPQVVAPHEESLDSLTLCQLLSQVFVPENVKKKTTKKKDKILIVSTRTKNRFFLASTDLIKKKVSFVE